MSSLRLEDGMESTAAGIADQVEAHVQRRLSGRMSDLHVVVLEGGMVLQGRTRTYHDKQLVQQAAMEVAELPILANEIRV